MALRWIRNVIFSVIAVNVVGHEENRPELALNGTGNISITLVDYLTTKYDKTVRPRAASGKPSEVFLDIYVESFGNIKEVNMPNTKFVILPRHSVRRDTFTFGDTGCARNDPPLWATSKEICTAKGLALVVRKEFPGFMYFRQMWFEDRIAKYITSDGQVLQREHISRLWLPDSYCYNAKTSDLMLPDTEVHSVIRIDRRGFIMYSRSTHIIASCEMDLHDFPMDTQRCKLSFGSYGHTDNDILLKWRNPTISIANKEMAQFSVGDATLSTEVNEFSTGNFTVLTVTFPFKRRMGYYIIQVYIPCIFLVMLSWIVFWMRPDDSASRLTVGITTILTIVFLLGYTNGMLPKVSYVKGMDWYLMVCFTIIFLSLLECIVVDRLWRANARKIEDERKNRNTRNSGDEELRTNSMRDRSGLNCRYVSGVQILRPRKADTGTQTNNEGGNRLNRWESNEHGELSHMIKDEYRHLSLGEMRPPLPDEAWVEMDEENTQAHYDTVVRCFFNKRNYRPMELSAKVDKASRILFPLTFLIYNIAYWVTYLHGINVLPYRI